MEEVPLVAVVESLDQLQTETLDVLLSELYHPTLQQSDQIVVAIFKYQIERSFALSKVGSIHFISDNFSQVDNVRVRELA